jgi:hypothetical protein
MRSALRPELRVVLSAAALVTNQWCSCSERKPPEPGLYFVLAESADPENPLFCTAWWEDGWSLMIPAFIPAITHWMKPARPAGERP